MTSTTMTSGGHQVSEALGLWEPTRTLTLEAARRHSARIIFMQRVLILAAIILIALLCWQFAKQAPTNIGADDPKDSVRMIEPRYSGRTSDGLPYKLKADFATRERQNATEVILDAPVLTFLRAAGAEESVINAKSGLYDDMSKVLNLNADVRLQTDDGYDCQTAHARIFAREKRIEGDKPIACTGSFGEVSGNAYEILENYSVFVFKDGMEAMLEREPTDFPLPQEIREEE